LEGGVVILKNYPANKLIPKKNSRTRPLLKKNSRTFIEPEKSMLHGEKNITPTKKKKKKSPVPKSPTRKSAHGFHRLATQLKSTQVE